MSFSIQTMRRSSFWRPISPFSSPVATADWEANEGDRLQERAENAIERMREIEQRRLLRIDSVTLEVDAFISGLTPMAVDAAGHGARSKVAAAATCGTASSRSPPNGPAACITRRPWPEAARAPWWRRRGRPC